MPMLQTRTADGDERLQDLDIFGNLLEETKGSATDIFVGMLLGGIKVNIKATLVQLRRELTRSLRIAFLVVRVSERK